MESAKHAVEEFVARDGKHQTSYDENVNRAVTEEHVRPHEHENLTTAIDKEIHQHHHHTIVQPINAKETMPEKHTHNMMPVEHKTFHHEDEGKLRAALDRESSKYKDSSLTHEATHSSSTSPTIYGEHVHHHVHEHVQPVIHKDTIVPHVVHTTIPIHETHHAESVHHGTTTLPAKTLSEYMHDKGTLEGRTATKLTEYEGCPKPYNKELQHEKLDADANMHLHSHDSHHHEYPVRSATTGTSGTAGTSGSEFQHDRTMRHHTTSSGLESSPVEETTTGKHSRHGRHDSAVDVGGSNEGMTAADMPHKKPSLAAKLNPFKDADGDGKRGFMD